MSSALTLSYVNWRRREPRRERVRGREQCAGEHRERVTYCSRTHTDYIKLIIRLLRAARKRTLRLVRAEILQNVEQNLPTTPALGTSRPLPQTPPSAKRYQIFSSEVGPRDLPPTDHCSIYSCCLHPLRQWVEAAAPAEDNRSVTVCRTEPEPEPPKHSRLQNSQSQNSQQWQSTAVLLIWTGRAPGCSQTSTAGELQSIRPLAGW